MIPKRPVRFVLTRSAPCALIPRVRGSSARSACTGSHPPRGPLYRGQYKQQQLREFSSSARTAPRASCSKRTHRFPNRMRRKLPERTRKTPRAALQFAIDAAVASAQQHVARQSTEGAEGRIHYKRPVVSDDTRGQLSFFGTSAARLLAAPI